jgi:hypothetical protein
MDNPLTEAIDLPLLRAWISLSSKHAIPYSVYWGTLLGQVRNQRIIPYDLDVDVVVGKLGLRIVQAMPASAANCYYNDELKNAPPWREGEIRLIVNDPQEWKWAHCDRRELLVEVHKDLVHARSLRGAVSLTYRDVVAERRPTRGAAGEPPCCRRRHGAAHNFDRLLHVSDIVQAARGFRDAGDEADLERLAGRTGARFAVAAGLDLAGRLFGKERCFAIARALRPVRYVRGARWLMRPTVVVSARDERRHVHAWRRALFRELVKRPQ